MATVRHIAIVANPYSGALTNRPRVEQLCAALEECGVTSDVFWSIEEAAEALRVENPGPAFGAMVAAGGDGTAAAAINLRRDLPLLVYPLGTENLLAQALGHTARPARAATLIAAGHTRHIDLGCATHHDADGRATCTWFTLMCSAGYDAAVAHRLARWRRTGDHEHLRRVRRRSYTRHMISEALGYSFPMVELEVEGEIVRGAHAFAFSISRYFSGLNFVPDAADDDGLLHWVVLRRPGRVNLLRYALAVRAGTHEHREDVVTGAAGRVVLRSADQRAAVALQIDGEAAGMLPVEIAVCPRMLPVLVPAQH